MPGLEVSPYEYWMLAGLTAGTATDVIGVLNRVLHAARAPAPLPTDEPGGPQ